MSSFFHRGAADVTEPGAQSGFTAGMHHVFLCATPFHLLSSMVVRDFIDSRESGARHVLAYAGGRPLPTWLDDGWAAKADGVPAPDRHPVMSRLAKRHKQIWKALSGRLALDRVRDAIPAHGPIAFHFAHLEDYLSNHCFFWPALRRRASYSLIPDGALNFYRAATTVRRLPSHVAKAAFAAATGLYYRPFTGLVTGLDRDRVECQFAIAPSVYRPDKAVVVPNEFWHRRLGAAGGGRGNATLVVGQEADIYAVGVEVFLDVWRDVAREIARRYEGACFYKPHPDYPYSENVVGELRRYIPRLRVLDKETRPIEMLLGELNVGTLVSGLSSALLHAKAIFGDRVDALCIGYRRIQQNFKWSGVDMHLSELATALTALGVETYEP